MAEINKHPYSDRYKGRNRDVFNKDNKNQNKPVNNSKKIVNDSKKTINNIERSIKSDIKKAEDFVEKEVVVVGKEFSTPRARKIEKVIIIIAYVLVLGIAAYFLIANLIPNLLPYSGTYELKASDSFLTSKLNSLYIDKGNIMSEKIKVDNKTLRLIVSAEPFNFVFNPKVVIADNATAELQLSFYNPETDIYLNDKLIIPDLSNYEKVIEYTGESEEDLGTEIWVKNDLVKNDSEYVQADFAEDFIYKNYPSNTIYSFAELGGTPLIQDYVPINTLINVTFRDNLKFAVYAENSLNISFIKQDLNWYVGRDEYTVTITDFQGNILHTQIFEDDSIDKDTSKLGKEQLFEINLKDLPRSVYYVSFVRDKYNKYSDSTVKNIEINSNKVLILDRFLPIEPFQFYTKIDLPKKIGFYYWWTGKDQIINVSGTSSKTIDLNKDWISKKYEEEFKTGEYSLNITKGYLWIYADKVSPSKENWFYLPQSSNKNLFSSDIIIIDKNKLQIDETANNVVYKEIIEINEKSKFKLQVLDELRVYFEKIKLIL